MEELIQKLTAIADDFDEESSRAESLGYSVEFSLGPYVEVNVNLLRQLRDFQKMSGYKPGFKPETSPREQANAYRKQVADLILKDEVGNDLVVTSPLERLENGSVLFQVGEDKPDGDRYKVTVKIEEV